MCSLFMKAKGFWGLVLVRASEILLFMGQGVWPARVFKCGVQGV